MLERMWRKGNPPALLVGMGTGAAILENCVFLQEFLKELKIDLPYDPAIALLGIYPKDTDAVKGWSTCTLMFLAAMSTTAKLWKEPRCPTKDEWIKKMWFMYTMEYYSAIRNDKYPPFASTWMELEGIMLSEVSQSEKDKHYMFSFIWGI